MSVEIQNVRKAFGETTAIAEISVKLDDGEFFVVLGPSGCGKSTLLRLIAGLEEVDEGYIILNGKVVSSSSTHVTPERRGVGVVFQSYALWPHMSVWENVAFPAEATGASRAEIREVTQRSLEAVDLTALAERSPAELSGGQRQRVALARCLAGGSRTILMDEPLANLDPHLRGRMEAEIHRFHRQAGVTTLYITHDQREAMALADRIAVMWEGRILQVAPPQVLHDQPANERVARFIGRAAILDGFVNKGVAQIGVLTVPVPERADGPARIVIRPGDIALGEGVPARLREVFYRGGIWEALAELDGLPEPLPVASVTLLGEGETVALQVTGGWALPG